LATIAPPALDGSVTDAPFYTLDYEFVLNPTGGTR